MLLLAPQFAAPQDFIFLVIISGTPAGDFSDGAITTEADITLVKTAIADTGAGHHAVQTIQVFHRSAALSSVTRASTQRPPCGVISFFQNGAWVFR